MANIFDISNKWYILLEQLDDKLAEVDFEEGADAHDARTIDLIQRELEVTKEDAEQKLEGYYYFIKEKEAEIAAIQDEIARLAGKIKSKENVIERLKTIVDTALRTFGEKTDKGNYKIKTSKVNIWNVFHKPLKVSEKFFVPEYMKFSINNKFDNVQIVKIRELLESSKIEIDERFQIDNTKVKEDLKNGKEIPGAYLDKNAAYVRFK